MWMLGSKSKGSLSVEVDFLDLCKHSVRRIEDSVSGGNLLNQRQCQDLSSKLSKTSLNIRELVYHCRVPADLFRPALENLYRYLEKARLLVHECAEEEWWASAVVQCQNENSFREILLDVSLCYNAIYEQARRINEDSSILPEDLRESSVFWPATDNDILRDQQDLRRRLEDLANEPSSVSVWDQFLPRRGATKQCLARYLLVKLNCTSAQSQVNTLDTCSAILWAKETEPSGAWGNYRLLGAGAGSSGVCSTKWMGIPCAKKEFHELEREGIFLKEAGILACLKHPCIVNFFCCGNGEERGDRFIAMELMEKSLHKLIEEQRNEYFSLPVVVEIMVQMARGMRYLHDQGVAHRDLKPQNVVVNRLTSPHLLHRFSVKLVDFGMSKTKVEFSKSNTMTAVGIGTTMYRAPEVHPDANPDGKGKVNWFKADVFSYSMTCAHLFSLRRPFGEMERLRELYKELMNGRRPELPREYPKELVALLTECWDSNPSSRPSFMEICRRLEMFQHTSMRGFSLVDGGLQEGQWDLERGFDFIKSVICVKSSIPRLGVMECGASDVVPTILCTCGRALECLPQPPYAASAAFCNICSLDCKGTVYHCDICNFDLDPDCAEIKKKVNVFFHAHPLHLLFQNHYIHKPDATCGFCKGSVEGSEWVYRCELCDFDVHALCTKYPPYLKSHPHPLTLMESLPDISLLCRYCNGHLEGFYYAFIENGYSAGVHPLCDIARDLSLCLCDCSYRLSLISTTAIAFFCGRCGTLGGSSWYYCCSRCNIDIHVGCVDDTAKEENNWIEAYDKYMLEYGTKDGHSKMCMISDLLDMLLVSNPLEESSSSSSRPRRVAKRVLPTTQMMVAYWICHQFSTDPDVTRWTKIAAETQDRRFKRKAKRMAAKRAMQEVNAYPNAEQGAMLENLEKLLWGLQNSVIMSQTNAEVLGAARMKLKKLYSAMHVNLSVNAGSYSAAPSSQFAQLDDPAGYGGLTGLVSTSNEFFRGVSTSLNTGPGFQPHSKLFPSLPVSVEFRGLSYSGYLNAIPAVGKAMVTDAGHWGVTCTCHGHYMSVAQFAQHAGINVPNPAEVVIVEGGKTLVQWRKWFYSMCGVELLLEDNVGWEWLEVSNVGVEQGNGLLYKAVMPQSWENAMDLSYVGSIPKKSRTTQMGDAPVWNEDALSVHPTELSLGLGQFYSLHSR